MFYSSKAGDNHPLPLIFFCPDGSSAEKYTPPLNRAEAAGCQKLGPLKRFSSKKRHESKKKQNNVFCWRKKSIRGGNRTRDLHHVDLYAFFMNPTYVSGPKEYMPNAVLGPKLRVSTSLQRGCAEWERPPKFRSFFSLFYSFIPGADIKKLSRPPTYETLFQRKLAPCGGQQRVPGVVAICVCAWARGTHVPSVEGRLYYTADMCNTTSINLIDYMLLLLLSSHYKPSRSLFPVPPSVSTSPY